MNWNRIEIVLSLMNLGSRCAVFAAALCLVLCMHVSISHAEAAPRFSDSEYESGFLDWTRTHLKSYSATEWLTRFAQWKKNLDFVDEFNKRGETFTVGLNLFADLSGEEFKALYVPRAPTRARSMEEGSEVFTGEGMKMPRAGVDWRNQGAVGAIKDQGQCGSCWTFGAAGAIESALKISGGPLTALSEQNLLDCETQYSSGCNGGSFTGAWQYVKNNGGIDTMASYPYEGVQKTCRYNAANSGATVGGWSNVATNEGALATAVATTPVVVGIRGDLQSFQFYKSGTYSDSACNASINHAVIAVGYDTDATGNFWIIRNSWGTSWGKGGYANMTRGVNMCGIANQAAFPTQVGKPATSAATTGSATTTGSGSTTTTSSPTTGSSTTGGSGVNGQIFIDALINGWQLAYSGNVSGQSVSASGKSGYAISATVTSGSAIVLARPASALPVSSFSKLQFDVKTSISGSVGYGAGLVQPSQSTTTSATWKSVVAALSTLGSPSSVQYLVFANKAAYSVVLSLDNVQFV